MNDKSLKEEIKNILRTTPIAGDFDRTRAIYLNEAVIDRILSLLVEKLEGMKKEPTISFEGGSPEYHIEYNQSLSDLIEKIEGK